MRIATVGAPSQAGPAALLNKKKTTYLCLVIFKLSIFGVLAYALYKAVVAIRNCTAWAPVGACVQLLVTLGYTMCLGSSGSIAQSSRGGPRLQ